MDLRTVIRLDFSFTRRPGSAKISPIMTQTCLRKWSLVANVPLEVGVDQLPKRMQRNSVDILFSFLVVGRRFVQFVLLYQSRSFPNICSFLCYHFPSLPVALSHRYCFYSYQLKQIGAAGYLAPIPAPLTGPDKSVLTNFCAFCFVCVTKLKLLQTRTGFTTLWVQKSFYSLRGSYLVAPLSQSPHRMGDHDLTTPQSLGRPSNEALRDDNVNSSIATSNQNDENGADSGAESPLPETPLSDSGAKPHLPMQKRRRVTRACDECRRKKIKCDGKQPCTHCTVYSYGQLFSQPNRSCPWLEVADRKPRLYI